jgi:cation:H+ antiporter
MSQSLIACIGGLLILYLGAEALIRGSVSLATRLGVSPFVIGLTIVAYGTSMPELVVSITASLGGHGDIAAGNVIGSNLFNIAVILGFSALICPLRIHEAILNRDAPIMAGVAFVSYLMLRNHYLGRAEGEALLAGIVLYTFMLVWRARRKAPEDTTGRRIYLGGTAARDLLYIVVGIIVLAAGSRLLTWGAVRLARSLGIGEAIIGLTIVSAGTSLPELAASIVAAIRKQPDISVGNIIGSNMFNTLAILGATSTIHPFQCDGIKDYDLYVMIGLSILLVIFMRTKSTLARWEGAVMLLLYAAYMCYLLPRL